MALNSALAMSVTAAFICSVPGCFNSSQAITRLSLNRCDADEVDVEEVGLFPGDVLLLCSDGLTRMVTEPEIAGTLQAEPIPQRAAEKLVQLANESGGIDNVTVIVVSFRPEPKGWFSWLRRGAHKSEGGNGFAGGR